MDSCFTNLVEDDEFGFLKGRSREGRVFSLVVATVDNIVAAGKSIDRELVGHWLIIVK